MSDGGVHVKTLSRLGKGNTIDLREGRKEKEGQEIRREMERIEDEE